VYPGFRDVRVEVPAPAGHVVAWVGGDGPPALLLHGYPQTRAMWHRVAPALAAHRTLVIPDLRGYGGSGAPAPDPEATLYAKRAMAGDAVALMDALGFRGSFAVVGHDRGARVGHRLALDHPGRVERLAVLDILPTRTLFRGTDQAFATAYWHWFFLIQPGGLPERMIGADPEWFVREILRRWAADVDDLDPRAVAEYVAAFDAPTIAASCADYRAAAGVDLVHDDADARAGRRLACPLLVMWGARGAMGRMYDLPAAWREVADDVRATEIDCGHFPAEERPQETAAALRAFLTESP
jgi:haloacetate dehalogenase